MLTAADTQLSIEPAVDAAGVDDHPRGDLGLVRDHAANFPVFAAHIDDHLGLAHRRSDLGRARHQQCVEGAAPNLKPEPGAANALSEAFEAAGTTPFNPNAATARDGELSQLLGYAELRQQRFDSWMQRFARPIGGKATTLEQRDARTPPGASNCSATPRRPGADHNYVGIDVSTVHGSAPRRIRSVPPLTNMIACSIISTSTV